MKLLIIFLAVWLGVASAAEPQRNRKAQTASSGEKRVALVIGNAAYPGAGALKNPVNDANDIAAKLKKLGFDVTVRTDMRYRDMLRSLTDFGDKVKEGSEALFFYAGHGMQVKGRNYLIPVDAEIRTEGSVSSEAVDVDQLLDKLSQARLSIVILDACRNNPFERRFRGGGQGLAQINAPTGTLIAYATAPGKVAADGDGRNGLYTQELLKAMDIPGMKIEDVFKRVRGNVIRVTGDAQTPWESSSLTGDFYFIFQGPTVVHVQQAPVDPETDTWKAAESTNTESAYHAYLDAYPKGRYAVAAHIRVNALKTLAVASASPSVAVSPAPTFMPPASVMAAEKQRLTAGNVFKDCAECPEMIMIPPGSFEMGSNNGDSDEKPVHSVTLKGFALSRTEVTQGQWREIIGNNPSSFSSCGDDCPVEQVNWYDAQEFIRRLSQKTGKTYRLPSESEWEYACRAGGTHAFCGSEKIDSVAWFDSNSGVKTHSVAGKQANAWGLYDMSGNVWEWTGDCWNSNYNNAPTDGSAWTTGDCSARVVRGGSWINKSFFTLSARRSWNVATLRNYNGGFRLVRMLE